MIRAGLLWLGAMMAPLVWGVEVKCAGEAFQLAVRDAMEREREGKGIPGLMISVYGGGKARGAWAVGSADREGKRRAGAEMKFPDEGAGMLVTALMAKELAEKDLLELSAPVTRYVPEFRPRNPYGEPVRVEHLLRHRGGLVRDVPGSVGEAGGRRGLEDVVRSLNSTELVYRPGSREKVSVAGYALLQGVLEKVGGREVERLVKEGLLAPWGMAASRLGGQVEREGALEGLLWSYHGKQVAVKGWGRRDRVELMTTAADLGRLAARLAEGGKQWAGWLPPGMDGDGAGQIEGERGLGEEGKREVGRREYAGGSRGFSSHLAWEEGKGWAVAVVATKDEARAPARRLARYALAHLDACEKGRPSPVWETTARVAAGEAGEWVGRYEGGGQVWEISEFQGRLWLERLPAGRRVELRQAQEGLVVDDALGWGLRVRREGGGLRIGERWYARGEREKPAPVRQEWRELLGEYGSEQEVISLLEREGRLTVLTRWFDYAPLEEVGEGRYRVGEGGGHAGEELRVWRDARGRVTAVDLGGTRYARRRVGAEAGEFRIRPRKPVEALRRAARQARPPQETEMQRAMELVELTQVDPQLRLDIRYASGNNFLGVAVYEQARAFLQRPAAEALARAHAWLRQRGYGMVVHDAYRPWFVTKIFWEATPAAQRMYVADPAQGSRHNRGCAVDVTLYELATGEVVEMPGGYDEMSERSWANYPGGGALARWHRDLLRQAMEREGFTVYPFEWWHFDYKDWREYPIGNLEFQEIGRGR